MILSKRELRVIEPGREAYTVVLDTRPAGTATVTPTSSDTAAATVSPATLTFTPSTWDTAQMVTVSSVEDGDPDNESVTIRHSVRGYGGGVTIRDVLFSITDDDVPGVMVDPVSLTVDEGMTGTYAVKLNTLITGNVTVTASSSDTGAASFSPATLVFTPSTWSSARTVTVTAVQDGDENDETVTVSHGVSGYTGVSSAPALTVTVNDDDTPGVMVTTPATLEDGMEEGATETYTVKLNTLPTGSVTVTPSSNDTAAASISPATLTFTTSSWSTAQTVTVTGVQDDDTDNETVTVSHGVSGYDGVSSVDAVTVAVRDDDGGVTITPLEPATLSEGGRATYTMALLSQPGGNVTVTASSSDTGAATVSPATLTFTTSSWSTAQTVTVTGVQDDDTDNETVTVSHGVSGYDGVSSVDAVTVAVRDDDGGVTITPLEPATLSEGGRATYTMALLSQPGGNVTVTASSSDTGAATVSPATLTFTTSSWSTAQTVTVSGVEDDDANDETVTVSHGVNGYEGVSSVDAVTLTISDADMEGVSLSATTLTVAEGAAAPTR